MHGSTPSLTWPRSSARAGRVAQVERLPDHLKAWEAGGRKAFDFMTGWADGTFPADATEIRMPSWITALPGWLCRHPALQPLDLSQCWHLTSLPAELANLTSLRSRDLDYCNALTGMPDLSGLPQLQLLWGAVNKKI